MRDKLFLCFRECLYIYLHTFIILINYIHLFVVPCCSGRTHIIITSNMIKTYYKVHCPLQADFPFGQISTYTVDSYRSIATQTQLLTNTSFCLRQSTGASSRSEADLESLINSVRKSRVIMTDHSGHSNTDSDLILVTHPTASIRLYDDRFV